jgi:hypothetical protein
MVTSFPEHENQFLGLAGHTRLGGNAKNYLISADVFKFPGVKAFLIL